MPFETGIAHLSGLHGTFVAAAGHFALEVEILPGDEVDLAPGEKETETGRYDDGEVQSHYALSLVFSPYARALC